MLGDQSPLLLPYLSKTKPRALIDCQSYLGEQSRAIAPHLPNSVLTIHILKRHVRFPTEFGRLDDLLATPLLDLDIPFLQ